MTGQEQYPQDEALKNDESGESPSARRKEFVEPELSQAIDVLEATTFFQAVTSGVTN